MPKAGSTPGTWRGIEDGHVRIVGRAKEIIVLSNGEKVPRRIWRMPCAVTRESRRRG